MIQQSRHLALFCLVALLLLGFVNQHCFSQSSFPRYAIIDSLVLGGEGGWDYLTVDTTAGRVYVSRGMRVQVVDLATHSIAGEIAATPGVHGIALVQSVGKGYTSNGRDSTVTIFQMSSLARITTLKLQARNPDAIMYEPTTRRVFTFNGGSKNATAIDAASDSVVGTVELTGKPEFAVHDGQGRVYVNIEDKSELIVFDAQSLKVLHTWPLAPAEEPSGLAIDRRHKRLFSVGGNRRMVILDSETGKVVGDVPIGDAVDGAAFDPVSQYAFSSNGEGTMTVVSQDKDGKYIVAGTVATRRSARTLVLDEKTGRIYTVAARFGIAPPPTPERPRPRPPIEPGSVTLYVLGRR